MPYNKEKRTNPSRFRSSMEALHTFRTVGYEDSSPQTLAQAEALAVKAWSDTQGQPGRRKLARAALHEVALMTTQPVELAVDEQSQNRSWLSVNLVEYELVQSKAYETAS
jgi:hypothetical protein